ncbi:hypothetical protein ACEOS4_005110 [Escherichia coli]|uniref:Uncharacterized protein n=1 Tax=Escherichia coli TaxID=562 RepID=A0A8S7IBC1_ECOLX|nr:MULTISPECIES: hypothetical protein [Escherichia]HDZ2876750.1 hypothetical protein [Klebsiella pneumoniae]EEV5627109.1 hypothetical protein [Escherichia coli]EEW5972501.1 hypothetical protein [Escherichia coli]EEY5897977.1 hypothetical protein [Escherichia coli]EFA5327538.1 hypothetical protein [Escherichia coli]
MAANSSRNKVSDTVTVYIRGGKASSRKVSRHSITQSAMNNAKTSFEIEGHRFHDSDWLKIVTIADQLDNVI